MNPSINDSWVHQRGLSKIWGLQRARARAQERNAMARSATSSNPIMQMADLSRGAEECVHVDVFAEDEREQIFVWKCKMPFHEPLRSMAKAWGEAHGQKPEYVGFEEDLKMAGAYPSIC